MKSLREKISLNRIICPRLELESFFQFAYDLNVCKVELRNDLPGEKIIDGYASEQVQELSSKYGIQIITINALQHFNLGTMLPQVVEELQTLVTLSTSIGCRAIVLCPHNDVNDSRPPEQCFKETVNALNAFAPLFEDSGLLGYIEPLGFQESSLRSVMTARKAIQKTEHSCYRLVHDTFHYSLSHETFAPISKGYDVSYTGLIHVSGVERELPMNQYRDTHRVFISSADKLNSREQIQKLIALGYTGDISFEPFAEEVQQMEKEDMKKAIEKSIDYILGS
jgi:2-keto-myo-inositol isomerase